MSLNPVEPRKVKSKHLPLINVCRWGLRKASLNPQFVGSGPRTASTLVPREGNGTDWAVGIDWAVERQEVIKFLTVRNLVLGASTAENQVVQAFFTASTFLCSPALVGS